MKLCGHSDAGSATVYVIGGCLLVGLVALLPISSGSVALARHRAAVAADAAALAGAGTADAGELADLTAATGAGLVERGCRRAAGVARADRAVLTSCVVIPCARGAESLQVEVRVEVAWVGLTLPGSGVEMPARAGDARCLPKSPP